MADSNYCNRDRSFKDYHSRGVGVVPIYPTCLQSNYEGIRNEKNPVKQTGILQTYNSNEICKRIGHKTYGLHKGVIVWTQTNTGKREVSKKNE